MKMIFYFLGLSVLPKFIVDKLRMIYGESLEEKTFEIVYNEDKNTYTLNVYD